MVDNDPAIAAQSRYLRSLAFVPTQHVVRAYEELLNHIQVAVWGPFLEHYLEPYYIGSPLNFVDGRADGMFPR